MKKVISGLVAWCMIILVSSSVLASSVEKRAPKEHWVKEEMELFKGMMEKQIELLEAYDELNLSSEASHEILEKVVGPDNWDKPIPKEEWARLVKMTIRLPRTEEDRLIDYYIIDFLEESLVPREDAVGCLIKLMTYYYGAGDKKGDYDTLRALEDYKKISARQESLIADAFTEGIVDASVGNTFRPKDKLTYAEGASMLYRVMRTHGRLWITDEAKHWVDEYVSSLPEELAYRDTVLQVADLAYMRGYDEVLPVREWADMLKQAMFALDQSSHMLYDYTYDLVRGGTYINRQQAIKGMMKLLPIDPRDATDEELAKAVEAFKDFDDVDDRSKVAIAYSSGIVIGYGDDTLKPDQLITYGEAAMMIGRYLSQVK